MPGTRPGMTECGSLSERDRDSDQRVVQIIPIRIHRVDEPHFPGTRPMLDVLLALDRRLNGVVRFVVDEALRAMLFRKAVDQSLTVLVGRFGRLLVTPA